MRLAIILPAGLSGGLLGPAAALARRHAARAGDAVLALPADRRADLAALREACGARQGISFRGFVWRPVPAEAAAMMLPGVVLPRGTAPVLLADDSARELRDADAWVFLGSDRHGRIPWLRPTAVWRLAPLPRRGGPAAPRDERGWTALAEAMTGWRRARCALAATEALREDLVGYAGIAPERALVAPAPDAAGAGEAALDGAHADLLGRLAADG